MQHNGENESFSNWKEGAAIFVSKKYFTAWSSTTCDNWLCIKTVGVVFPPKKLKQPDIPAAVSLNDVGFKFAEQVIHFGVLLHTGCSKKIHPFLIKKHFVLQGILCNFFS